MNRIKSQHKRQRGNAFTIVQQAAADLPLYSAFKALSIVHEELQESLFLFDIQQHSLCQNEKQSTVQL